MNKERWVRFGIGCGAAVSGYIANLVSNTIYLIQNPPKISLTFASAVVKVLNQSSDTILNTPSCLVPAWALNVPSVEGIPNCGDINQMFVFSVSAAIIGAFAAGYTAHILVKE